LCPTEVEGQVVLRILIREKKDPQIYAIEIIGNQKIPFDFIYRLLGLNPGDRFDVKELEDRINYLYSLGYFKTIEYEIDTVKEDYIHLCIRLKERPFQKLLVGLHYSDRYKMVAAINLQSTNLLPGLRIDNRLEFIGLNRYQFRVYYPSRTLDFPLYPFLTLDFQDIPTWIYNFQGRKIATYHNRSTKIGIGLGFLNGKYLDIEGGFYREYMNIDPDIAYTDPGLFPSWRNRLNKIEVRYYLDLLDNFSVPKKGVLVNAALEGSLIDLGSEVEYTRASVNGNVFYTFRDRYTFRFNMCHCQGWQNLPLYKAFYLGGMESFIGVEPDQLAVDQVTILRLDLNYNFLDRFAIKFVINTAMNYRFEAGNISETSKMMWGYGTGLSYNSPLGPLELMLGYGEKSIFELGHKRFQLAFRAGYIF
jgi:NTE family protein